MEIPYKFRGLDERIIKYGGITKENYDENWLIWLKNHNDTFESWKEFMWKLYNLLLAEYAKVFAEYPKEMYNYQRNVYCEMFGFLIAEGKKVDVAQAGINHCDLQRAALLDIPVEIEILGGNRCEQSAMFNGRRLSVEEVIKQKLVPYKGCKREGGCVCMYLTIPIRK